MRGPPGELFYTSYVYGLRDNGNDDSDDYNISIISYEPRTHFIPTTCRFRPSNTLRVRPTPPGRKCIYELCVREGPRDHPGHDNALNSEQAKYILRLLVNILNETLSCRLSLIFHVVKSS